MTSQPPDELIPYVQEVLNVLVSGVRDAIEVSEVIGRALGLVEFVLTVDDLQHLSP